MHVFFVLFAFILNYILCYPGFLTADSYSQYLESIDLKLSNHHPPLLAIMWHYLGYIHQGPQILLALNMLMLWLSIFLLLKCFSDKYPRACFFMLIMPFTPAVIGNSAIIWKDVLLGNSVLFSISLSIYAYYRQSNVMLRLLVFVLAAIVLFVGVSVKFQGKFIAPLVLLLMSYVIWKKPIRVSMLLAVGMTIGFYWLNLFVNQSYNVIDTRSEQLRQFFDIAGTSICLNEDLMPEYVKGDPRYSFEKIKKLYVPAFVNPYIGDGEKSIYKPTTNEADLNELQNTFFRSALKHPACYLKHRLGTFIRLERGGNFIFNDCHGLTIPIIDSTKELCDFNGNFYVNYIMKYVSAFKFLSRNYFFLLANLIFIGWVFIKHRQLVGENKTTALLCGYISLICIFFTLVMFFTTMAADHRYLYLVRVITSIFLPIQVSLLLKSKIT